MDQSPTEHVEGRISKPAFYAVTAFLFAFAMTAAIGRFVTRARQRKWFQLDDSFLFLACLCLVVTTTLLFQMIPTMYFLQDLQLNPSAGFLGPPPGSGSPANMPLSSILPSNIPSATIHSSVMPRANPLPSDLAPSSTLLSSMAPTGMSGAPPAAITGSPSDMSAVPEEFTSAFVARITAFRRKQEATTILSWTALFCVKFSFLALFRHLVSRIRSVTLYWRGICVFTLIAYAYCVSEPFFDCRAAQASDCGHGSARTRMIRLQSLSIMLDIVTDVLLVTIPIRLLWKVRIPIRQKLSLWFFFCISICMAVVSAVRVGGEQYRGNYDFSWLFLWLQVEVSLAVLVVSLLAFAGVLTANPSARGSSGPAGKKPSWSSFSGSKSRTGEKLRSTDDKTGTGTGTGIGGASEWPSCPPNAVVGSGRRNSRLVTSPGDDPEEVLPLGQHAQPEGQQDVVMQDLDGRNFSTATTIDERVERERSNAVKYGV